MRFRLYGLILVVRMDSGIHKNCVTFRMHHCLGRNTYTVTSSKTLNPTPYLPRELQKVTNPDEPHHRSDSVSITRSIIIIRSLR